jgi:hypothetical protein
VFVPYSKRSRFCYPAAGFWELGLGVKHGNGLLSVHHIADQGAKAASDAMARITAARLVRHPERSGFVLMEKPAAPAPTVADHSPRRPLAD